MNVYKVGTKVLIREMNGDGREMACLAIVAAGPLNEYGTRHLAGMLYIPPATDWAGNIIGLPYTIAVDHETVIEAVR
jgi:hypothetical protein